MKIKVILLIGLFILVGLVSFKLLSEDTLISSLNKTNYKLIKSYGRQRIIFIDYSLPSFRKRLWVIEGDTILLNCRVSHAKNSGLIYATNFSNISKSHKTCIGKFKSLDSYNGKHGLSMRIKGLDNTNNNALSRAIVFHSADYAEFNFLITHGYLGRSLGCFVTAKDDNVKIIKLATEKKSIPIIVVR